MDSSSGETEVEVKVYPARFREGWVAGVGELCSMAAGGKALLIKGAEG